MALVIVRHGVAVPKQRWRGDDAMRPLTPQGYAQAEALAAWLGAPAVVERIVCSPTLRCLATVLPLATAHGGSLSTCAALLPGRVTEATALAAALLHEHGTAVGPAAVVCSHGEVIPELLSSLGLDGSSGPLDRNRKGSAWTITRGSDGAVHGEYRELASV